MAKETLGGGYQTFSRLVIVILYIHTHRLNLSVSHQKEEEEEETGQCPDSTTPNDVYQNREMKFPQEIGIHRNEG